MQGDPDVLKLLNEQLTSELTAINQYFLHAKMQEHWGFTALAAHTRAESFDEMRHAEVLTDRILMLSELPNYQRINPLRITKGPGVVHGTTSIAWADNTYTFDKVSDVYYGGVLHEENQPAHLLIADTEVCITKCTEEFGNPCFHFCPAQVYEPQPTADGRGKVPFLNFTNCFHCKTCDIMDPYQIIDWVPPEGGEGPQYDGM